MKLSQMKSVPSLGYSSAMAEPKEVAGFPYMCPLSQQTCLSFYYFSPTYKS